MLRSRYISKVHETVSYLTSEQDGQTWVNAHEVESAMAASEQPKKIKPKKIRVWRTALALQRLVNDGRIEEGRKLRSKGNPALDMGQVALTYAAEAEARAEELTGLDAQSIEFGGFAFAEKAEGGLEAQSVELDDLAFSTPGKAPESLILGSKVVYRLSQPSLNSKFE